MTTVRSSPDPVASLADRLGRDQIFGPPVQQGGTTLVPVAKVHVGGGIGSRHRDQGGDPGFVARPAGAWAIHEDGEVAWHPAVDVNRIVLGASSRPCSSQRRWRPTADAVADRQTRSAGRPAATEHGSEHCDAHQ